MKKRTRARELALQYLYQLDLLGDGLETTPEEFVRTEEPDKATRQFTIELLDGAREHADEIDGIIREVAQNWDLERMAVIDRNVLRLATWELLWCDDIPPKVSISEYVDVAKAFFDAGKEAKFVNAVLDHMAREARPDAFAG